jgi:CRISPR-associated protein (TIGR03986 family)
MSKFLYPYNFVRVEENRPPALEAPAGHHRLDPNRLTGTVRVEVILESPLFVPDPTPWREVDVKGGKHKWLGFYQVDGLPSLPATSIKGMLRSDFEALTNSCFLTFGSSARHIGLRYNPKRADQPVQDFKAGRMELHDGQWQIQPMKVVWTDRPLSGVKSGSCVPYQPSTKGKHVGSNYQLISEQWHRILGRQTKPVPIVEQAAAGVGPVGWFKPSWLLRPTDQQPKHHHDRLFIANGEPSISLEGEVVDAYNRVLKSQHELISTGAFGERSSHTLPTELSPGDLIYYRKSENLLYKWEIARTAIPRVSSDWSVGELLPPGHHACGSAAELCPACRVFGWVKSGEHGAYAGHLRIESIKWKPQKGWVAAKEVDFTELRIQGTPHPESANRYVTDREGRNSAHVEYQHSSGGQPKGRLRGRKRYWVANSDERNWRMPEDHPYRGEVQSIHAALLRPEHGSFEFTIRFDNLQKWELGALLFAMEWPWPEARGVSQLGRGKSLGLGVVELRVVGEPSLVDVRGRYGAPPSEAAALTKDLLLTEFQQRIGALGKAADDLRLLTQRKQVEARYPRFRASDKAQMGEKTFRWFMDRDKNRRDIPLPLPQDAMNPASLCDGDDGANPDA